MKLNWEITNDYLCAHTNDFMLQNKLAMFDLDNTLITTKKGKRFPVDENDWKFRFDNVMTKLKKLSENSFSIIIVSNQSGIATGIQTIKVWTAKLNKIVEKMDLDIMVFCSIAHNKYRKPSPIFFHNFILRKKFDIDYDESFYCGDACGRNGDFSDSDLKFALNCMLKFKTPEFYFSNVKSIIPKISYPKIWDLAEESPKIDPIDKEIIIMVGFPASGKSHVSKYLNQHYNYTIINQDILKTKMKCKKFAIESMKLGKSIIIDATNPSREIRKEWINLGKLYNYTIRAIHMTTNMELSFHNNCYRNIKYGANCVPKVAYNVYKSKFDEPKKQEGLSEIIKMNFGKVGSWYYNFYLF